MPRTVIHKSLLLMRGADRRRRFALGTRQRAVLVAAVESSCGSCKRPVGRASSPFVVDLRSALRSAGLGAGASAGGLFSSESSLELHIYCGPDVCFRPYRSRIPRQLLTFNKFELTTPESHAESPRCANFAPGLACYTMLVSYRPLAAFLQREPWKPHPGDGITWAAPRRLCIKSVPQKGF